MTYLAGFFSGTATTALGWGLVHFLWQGTLLAIVLAGILAALSRRPAAIRYGIAYAALLAALLLPIGTSLYLMQDTGASPGLLTPTVSQANEPDAVRNTTADLLGGTGFRRFPGIVRSAIRALGAFIQARMPLIVMLWLTGLMMMALWHTGGWVHVQRAVRTGVSEMPEPWPSRMGSLCRDSGVQQPVRLMASTRVGAPIVVGLWRPVILVPLGVLTGLAPGQLEAVIAHELAHVRRYDYAANLLEALVVSLLFYHPAIWWISRRIHDERERCCDQAAIRFCKEGPIFYARALVALQELCGPAPLLPPAANDGSLLRRITGLVGSPQPASHNTVASVLLSLLVVATVAACTFASDTAVDAEKAMLMGRVEAFYMSNYRDVSARKSLEWGEVEHHDNGTVSIRYMCLATIWDKEKLITNEVFSFDKNGAIVKVEKVPGYPQKPEPPDTKTKEGMAKLIEEFFRNNYRDISARETLELGEVVPLENGNSSIRYKARITIRDKKQRVLHQDFVFGPDGRFVSNQDVPEDAGGSALPSAAPAQAGPPTAR